MAYDSSTKRVYIDTSTTPHQGVSIYDVQRALADSHNDVGNLCRSGFVNKWAKFKSFAYPSWGFPTSSAYLAARRSKNCGLAMLKYASTSAAWTAGVSLTEGGTDWVHAYPTGGSSQPYRLLDFDEYLGVAAAPFQVGPDPNPAYKIDTVRVNDAAGAGAADIEKADLAGDGTACSYGGTTYHYYNLSSFNVYCMLGKRTGGTPAAAPSLIYSQSSIIPNNRLSDGTWDCVTIFVDPNVSITEGTFISTNGDIVLAPVGRRSFVYHNTLGVNYNDTGFTSLTLVMRLSSYSHAISYSKLVLITKNMAATTTIDEIEFATSGGELTPSVISTFRLYPTASNPNNARYYLRLWTGGSYYEEEFFPQYSPTE